MKPGPTATGFLLAAHDVIAPALSHFAFPVGPGEVCSERMDVGVPAGRAKLLVKIEADTAEGTRDRDALKLTCAPVGTALKSR